LKVLSNKLPYAWNELLPTAQITKDISYPEYDDRPGRSVTTAETDLNPANPTYIPRTNARSVHKKLQINNNHINPVFSKTLLWAPFDILVLDELLEGGGFELTRNKLQVRKRTPCYYSRSHSCYSCHSTATTDSDSTNLLKAAKYSPTDLNTREMFRRKETICPYY
jgi:hypothetical protein